MIRIYGTDYTNQFVRKPITNNPYSMHFFSYEDFGRGRWCLPLSNAFTTSDIARVLEQMQERLPLGLIGEYEVLLLAYQQKLAADPVSGSISAERLDGYITVSAAIGSMTLSDLMTHEFAHELDRQFLTEVERRDFFALLGMEKPSELNDVPWHERAQEIMAEYISLAVWDEPLRNPYMRKPSAAEVAKVREWAMRRFGGYPKALVAVYGEVEPVPEPVKELRVFVGQTTATVAGKDVTFRGPARIFDGITYVPLWDFAEHIHEVNDGKPLVADFAPKPGPVQEVWLRQKEEPTS